jgi:hypothetical protein
MFAKELESTLTTCIREGFPVLIKGAPGVGKTSIIEKVGRKIKYDLVVSHPVISGPEDFKGQPWVIDGKATFLPYGDLQILIDADKPTIYFLDDLGQASPSVQAACMQLLLARRINDHKVSNKVVFIAATNRREDRAGVTGILEPVKSRFYTILELQANTDDWILWAYENDMPAKLIGYLSFQPQDILTNEATADIVNHPNPRCFEHVGRLINVGLENIEVLSGAIGSGCAAKMIGFFKVYADLPEIAGILLRPDTSPIPTEPSAKYAVISALVEKMTLENEKQIFKYGNRMTDDFSTLLVRNMIRKNAKIQNTKSFIEWATNHKDVLI